MGDFSESPRWKLINDFTIHEDGRLHDRPFMRTCVPKPLNAEITSFQIVHLVEWPSTLRDEVRPARYADASYIRFNANINHNVTVFTMKAGEVASFRTLTDSTIRPLPAGQIGGKHKANVFDGIYYSGMSSRDVPAEGLMDGEPGVLSYVGEFDGRDGDEKTSAELTATLFLDEDKFSQLVAMLSLSPRAVSTFNLCILAELFESEMSASLSEVWMRHDYGLLSEGQAVASVRARIEHVATSTGVTVPIGVQIDDQNHAVRRDHDIGNDSPHNQSSPLSVGSELLTMIKYQRYILGALFLLILTTLIAR